VGGAAPRAGRPAAPGIGGPGRPTAPPRPITPPRPVGPPPTSPHAVAGSPLPRSPHPVSARPAGAPGFRPASPIPGRPAPPMAPRPVGRPSPKRVDRQKGPAIPLPTKDERPVYTGPPRRTPLTHRGTLKDPGDNMAEVKSRDI